MLDAPARPVVELLVSHQQCTTRVPFSEGRAPASRDVKAGRALCLSHGPDQPAFGAFRRFPQAEMRWSNGIFPQHTLRRPPFLIAKRHSDTIPCAESSAGC